MIKFLSLWLALSALPELAGQLPAQPPGFEVASIREHLGAMPRIDITISGSRLTAEGQTLRGLITYAWDLKPWQISDSNPTGSNRGLSDTFYDVVAKGSDSAPPASAEFREMMRKLLVERFRLKFHMEMKEIPVYALTVDKRGPRFKESAPNSLSVSNHGVHGSSLHMTLVKATMESVASNLDTSFGVDRPVVDGTGLTGRYDITLEATPEYWMKRAADDPGTVSIFTALQEQLGLRLESRKAPVQFLVVDHVELPSSN